jgi:PAS domain S-box-containing protein
MIALFLEGIRGGDFPVHYENPILTRDGRLRKIRWTNAVLRDNEGKVVGSASIGEDVTDVHDLEERLRLFIEHAPDLLYRYRLPPDRGFDYVSPSAKTITGFGPEDFYADPRLTDSLVHPDDAATIASIRNDLTLVERPRTLRWIHRDGSVVWIEERSTLVHDDRGVPIAIEGVARDVSERMRAEQLLRERDERYRSILQASIDGFFVLDQDGRFVEVNDAFVRMLGYQSDELLQMPIWAVVDGKTEQEFRALADGLRERGYARFERRYRRANGALIDVEVSVNLRNEGGRDRFVTFARDVTQRNRTQERLRADVIAMRRATEERTRLLSHLVAAQEEERVRISADVHDDPVQKLAAVGIRLSLLEQHVAGPPGLEALRQVQETIRTAIKSLRRLVFDLQPASLEQDGLVEAIREFAVRSGLADEVTVDVLDELDREPAPDTARIAYRIVQEALINVRKHAHAQTVEIHVGARKGALAVTIRDDGVGFDPERANTPIPGHVGLASIRERAELAGGTASITSHPGAGTTVRFVLPIRPEVGIRDNS